MTTPLLPTPTGESTTPNLTSPAPQPEPTPPFLPTPTGQSPTPNLTSSAPQPAPITDTYAEAVAYYTNLLDTTYGVSVGNSYKAYAAANPSLTAYAALQGWAGTEAAALGPSLAKVVGEVATAAGTTTTQIATGTGAGAAAVSGDIGNPIGAVISALDDIADIPGAIIEFDKEIYGFFKALTDKYFWISMGWLLLGLLLLAIGAIILARQELEGKSISPIAAVKEVASGDAAKNAVGASSGAAGKATGAVKSGVEDALGVAVLA
jgi:hypothetical protein